VTWFERHIELGYVDVRCSESLRDDAPTLKGESMGGVVQYLI